MFSFRKQTLNIPDAYADARFDPSVSDSYFSSNSLELFLGPGNALNMHSFVALILRKSESDFEKPVTKKCYNATYKKLSIYHGNPLIFIGATFQEKLVSHRQAVNINY